MVRLSLLAAAAALLSGCGRVWLPDAVERRAGELMARQMREEMPPVNGSPWQPFVDDAGRKLAAASERPDYPFRFVIVHSEMVNAFALPDGEVFVTDALLRAAGKDRVAVAAVLAHEVGHVARRHGAEGIQSRVGLGAAAVLVFGLDKSLGAAAASLASQLVALGYGRDMELEADYCAVRYLTRLGYPPRDALRFLSVIAAKEQGAMKDPGLLKYVMSHPPTADRIRLAGAYADTLTPRSAPRR